MCYIQVSLRLDDSKRNTDIEQLIKNTAINEMEYNTDGSFVKDGASELRTLNRSEAINAIVASDINGLMLHHRTATSGAVTNLNVHGWTKGKWQFFHNGWASGAGALGKTEIKSDSLVFFNTLLNRLERVKKDKAIAKAIQKTAEDTYFQGRAVLLDNENNRAFFFGDFELYLINQNYLVVCSTREDFEVLAKSIVVAGLQFDEAQKIPFHVLHEQLDGIFVLDNIGLPEAEFTYISKFDNQYSYEQNNFNNRDYNTPTPKQIEASIDKTGGVDINEYGDEIIILDEHLGYWTTEDDADYGYYDQQGNFYGWENSIDPDIPDMPYPLDEAVARDSVVPENERTLKDIQTINNCKIKNRLHENTLPF